MKTEFIDNIYSLLQTSMKQAYFSRHGETIDNRNRIIQGQKDSALTENGIESIRQRAELLKGMHFDAVYCSELGRARKSLEIINDELNLKAEIIYLKEIMEIDFGAYSKRSIDELRAEITRHKNTGDLTYPGGESGDMLKERVCRFIDERILGNSGDSFLVVTHFGVIETILQNYTNLNYDDIRLNKDAILRLAFNGKDVEQEWIR